MRLKASIFLLIAFLFFSCRGDQEETQTIDQVLALYVRNSTNQDLLNTTLDGSYSSIALLDLKDVTANKPISGYALKKDLDLVNYLDYTAGAVRVLSTEVTSDPEEKIYYSEFKIQYFKLENSVSTLSSEGIIKIEYSWKPSQFSISRVLYDDDVIFTKVIGQPNKVIIVK